MTDKQMIIDDCNKCLDDIMQKISENEVNNAE